MFIIEHMTQVLIFGPFVLIREVVTVKRLVEVYEVCEDLPLSLV